MNGSLAAETLTANSGPGAHLVGELVGEVVTRVARDMRGQQASLVYQILDEKMTRRLPGICVDQEHLRVAAARIAIGLSPA